MLLLVEKSVFKSCSDFKLQPNAKRGIGAITVLRTDEAVTRLHHAGVFAVAVQQVIGIQTQLIACRKLPQGINIQLVFGTAIAAFGHAFLG